MEGVVEHFSHPGHNLSTRINDPTSKEAATCDLCEKKVTSPTVLYSCTQPDCDFHLHKECFELPPRIKVTLHGKHRALKLGKSSFSQICGICLKPTTGFGYICPQEGCYFMVHVECVNSSPCIVNGACRDHQFVRIPVSASYKSISYTCEACGLDCDDVDFNPGYHYKSDVPYMCKLCHILVHEECLELPPTVRIRYHPRHRISHTYYLGEQEELVSHKSCVEEEEEVDEEEKKEKKKEEEREDEGEEQIDKRRCGVCDAKMNFDHGGYRCGDCGFVCHAKCIEMFVINDDEESKEEFEEFDEPSFVVVRESPVEEGPEKKVVIEEMKHFSHRHNLILLQDINEQSRDGSKARCECCARLIQPCFSSPPSCYGCPVPGCEFYMHTSCATLQRQIRLLNETPATLIQLEHIAQCDICGESCNGFAYFYTMTQEHYCIQCSRLSQLDSIKHRCHMHARGKCSRIFLARGQGRGGSFHCDACGKLHTMNEMFFTCISCNFFLDMKCAALPIRAKAPDGKHDDHDLVLTSRPHRSDSYQSLCLVCEEERNPDQWFYHCGFCDINAHIECVVGKYPSVKFGGSYKFRHPHTLKLVQYKKEKHRPSCYECEANDFEVGYQCATSECEYVMCVSCSLDEL